jgi:hypothetical protein
VGAIGNRPLDAARSSRWNYRKQHSFSLYCGTVRTNLSGARNKAGKQDGNTMASERTLSAITVDLCARQDGCTGCSGAFEPTDVSRLERAVARCATGSHEIGADPMSSRERRERDACSAHLTRHKQFSGAAIDKRRITDLPDVSSPAHKNIPLPFFGKT